MPEKIIDLSAVETDRDRLRCPRCGRWARRLLLVSGSNRPICGGCARQQPGGDAA